MVCCENAIVSDFLESTGKDMLDVKADELLDGNRTVLYLAAIFVILVTVCNFGICKTFDSAVANRNTANVPADVLQCIAIAIESLFAVDDPVLGVKMTDEAIPGSLIA